MTDREWLETMWFDHAGKVYAYASRRVGPHAADDVVADTFVVAWRNRRSRPRRELPWLYGVARRVIADRRRSEGRRERLTDRVSAAAAEATSDGSEAVAIAATLETLAETDREVLRLVAWEGLSPKDAAAVLGITGASFRMRLSRARHRLAAALEEGS